MTSAKISGVKTCPLIVQAKGNALLASFKVEKESPNIRTKLALIAQGCTLLAEHVTLENELKIKALTVIVRDKAAAGAKNGRPQVANIQSQRSLSSRGS